MQKVTIIGGTSGFGEWLAKFILEHFYQHVELTITGTNREKSQRVATQLGCFYSLDNRVAVQEADITIFSTPISLTQQVIETVAPHIKKGSLALDVTSIKKFPSKALQKYCDPSVLVIPTHPMFGPYVSTIAGQIFVLTPEENVKTDPRYIFLKNFLEKSAAKVIETTAQEHDKMMAVVQGLTHFNMFVFGETIRNLNINISRSLDFVSPIYKIIISSVSRYIYQNPKLYSDIQIYNDEILDVHRSFMQATEKYHQIIEQQDEIAFMDSVNENKKFFGDNAKKGQIYTDKIIYLIGKQSQYAEQNIGKMISIRNIYNGKIIQGILDSFTNNILFINNNSYHFDEWELITQ